MHIAQSRINTALQGWGGVRDRGGDGGEGQRRWGEGQRGWRWGDGGEGRGVMGGGTEGWEVGRGQLTFCTHTGPLGFM